MSGAEAGTGIACEEKKKSIQRMNHSASRKGVRQQYLSGAVVCFLAVYSLNLCTLNPLLHAETLDRTAQRPQAATGHCARPSAAPHTTSSHTTSSPDSSQPLCCELRGAHNKTLLSPLQLNTVFLYVLTTLFPPREEELGHTPFLLRMQEYRYSHAPPYLAHCALLI